MNAANLYQEIKDALATFGLRFNQMDMLQVRFKVNQVIFDYNNKSLTVRTND